MLLAFDIGNSQTEIGLFSLAKQSQDNLLYSFRIKTRKKLTEDELGLLVLSLVHSYSGSSIKDKVKGIICSSVVPSLNAAMLNMGRKYFGQEVLFVSRKLKLDISFAYPNPEEVGADRIVNAVAVSELYGSPAIILDFGTASTYCLIDKDKRYIGGVIAAGVKLSLDALTMKAEKLSAIDLRKPDRIIGKNTKEAISSGIYFSAIAALEGIIRRIKKEYKLDKVKIIATGGISPMIYKGTQIIDILDTKLTLKGLDIIFHKNT